MYNWGGFRNFSIGVGGEGGVKLCFRKDCWTFLAKLLLPHKPHTPTSPHTPTPPHPLPPDAVTNKIPWPVKKWCVMKAIQKYMYIVQLYCSVGNTSGGRKAVIWIFKLNIAVLFVFLKRIPFATFMYMYTTEWIFFTYSLMIVFLPAGFFRFNWRQGDKRKHSSANRQTYFLCNGHVISYISQAWNDSRRN